MKNYISLLRGINVGGHKKILMADLKSLFQDLGFKNIQTYIQSGNVVFEAKETDLGVLEKMILEKIKTHYDFDVPVLILIPKQVEDAISKNPFEEYDKLSFTFLAENPTQENIDIFNSFSFDNEFFELKDNVVYAHYPNGAGNAKMNHTFIERKLKVTATSRNLRTTKKLLEMAIK